MRFDLPRGFNPAHCPVKTDIHEDRIRRVQLYGAESGLAAGDDLGHLAAQVFDVLRQHQTDEFFIFDDQDFF